MLCALSPWHRRKRVWRGNEDIGRAYCIAAWEQGKEHMDEKSVEMRIPAD